MQFLQLYQFIYCFDEEKSVISMDTLSITDLLEFIFRMNFTIV